MNKLLKNKKKKGFTLVELIAVMAILAILAAVIAPKASAYILKAKKTKIVQQCHTLILAVDAYNVDAAEPIKEGVLAETAQDKASNLVGETDIDKISKAKVSTCREIANGGPVPDLTETDCLKTETADPK